MGFIIGDRCPRANPRGVTPSEKRSYPPSRISLSQNTCFFHAVRPGTSRHISSTVVGLSSSFNPIDSAVSVVTNGINVASLEASKSFEPVVNVPALSSFLIIGVIFALLQIRISLIRGAVTRRQDALKALREIKSRQLSSADLGEAKPSEEAVALALLEYETALENEEGLRTVIPGVRVVAPNRPSEDDADAAKRFLGVDLRDDSREQLTETDQDKKEGMSVGAISVLVLVAMSQIALLYMLSFDPMKASTLFSAIGGDP
eukprot:CAMPEP_0198288582 /NCGR_PEP_ID=MMETSP1449-20131203/7033_1 /TAXON_ID=420275 /ORGANISM="Attheya septentrionalis, Strain CCMP2084" /LENGTH=259 /DNA_ID=CAMNT_0043986747 /DNA_START=61 /DNA_END=836 /DNA_ORIENTATION=+